MPSIIVGSTTYVAGLSWTDTADPKTVARRARRAGYRWYAPREGQSGLASNAEDHAEGQPSLAAALCGHLPPSSWIALVEGDGDTYALVQVVDNQILPSGDKVYHQRGTAVDEFESRRHHSFAGRFATPGLVEGAAGLELASMPVAEGAALRPVPAPRVTRRRLAAAAAGAAALAAAGGGFAARESIVDMLSEREEVAQVIRAEPRVEVEIDGPALVRRCRDALRSLPRLLPSWRVASVRCQARFTQSEIVAAAPGLRGRPAVLVQWALEGGFNSPAQRELAIRRLAGWPVSQVGGTAAWAVAGLPPALRRAPPPPAPLAWRRAVDRALGPRVERMDYTTAPGTAAVTIHTSRPLGHLAELVGRVPALEVTSLVRQGDGWQVTARLPRPFRMKESEFMEMRRGR